MSEFSEKLIEDCLTDKAGYMRSLGRLMATSIAEDFSKWVEAECEQGGDEHGLDMLWACSKFFGLLAQAVAKSHFRPEGHDYVISFSTEKYYNAMRDS